ncbi:hypothetical protein OIU76_003565 [Salix suchowensis]|nr:hypothetical protein OIU76_003565 [Salix suchowensis]
MRGTKKLLASDSFSNNCELHFDGRKDFMLSAAEFLEGY